MNKNIIKCFIALDIIWALSALVYDLPAIKNIPFYYWPCLIICPIFPALLALVWRQIDKNQNISPYLLTFASAPSAIYFIAAVIYYPSWIILNGFNWLAFGQIFWVALYGLQGWYLLLKYRQSFCPRIAAFLFLVISFVIQFHTRTYGYIDFLSFGEGFMMYFYLFLTIISGLILLWPQNNFNTSSHAKAEA